MAIKFGDLPGMDKEPGSGGGFRFGDHADPPRQTNTSSPPQGTGFSGFPIGRSVSANNGAEADQPRSSPPIRFSSGSGGFRDASNRSFGSRMPLQIPLKAIIIVLAVIAAVVLVIVFRRELTVFFMRLLTWAVVILIVFVLFKILFRRRR